MKKYVWWGIGGLAILALLITIVATRPMPIASESKQKVAPSADTKTNNDKTVAATGRYSDYSAGLVDDSGYSTTILFFYAGWCPECRGYDMAIKDSVIPDGTQILKVTYDDEQTLRKKHGVTIQSSFVRVDSAGDKQVLWNGYGREKSLSAILENTK